ncbi:putative uncharacterized protein [Pseudomonas sp. StFLB209]|uniref:hypothetical protein n=1 Tax=Pseudomonas sp. StFLB209 TaxID=1028989 RepID=UPI0004F7D08F|nr:hypothetical protein [Pseudomonas sp. StFLB209]BAP44788.1 putative uncharacterized protein [Pseudomonas sp. StFLB209]
MQRIEHYAPPTAEDLARLKSALGFTSAQMADLAGLAKGSQWRKYTGRTEDRVMGMHMHFYMAALLTLPAEMLAQIVEKMREDGADVDLGLLPAELGGMAASEE